jgi:hypothetical protein
VLVDATANWVEKEYFSGSMARDWHETTTCPSNEEDLFKEIALGRIPLAVSSD